MRSWMALLAWCLSILALSQAPSAAQTATSLNLRRGVSTFPWLHRAASLDNDGLRFVYDNPFPYLYKYTPDTFATLHTAGADFIRVPLDPSPLVSGTQAQRAALIKVILPALRSVTTNGMVAVIDIHPRNSNPAWTVDKILGSYASAYQAAMVQFARAINASGMTNVVLELMNEPPGGYGSNEPYSWLKIQIDLVRAIRVAAPKLTLLLSGDQSGGIAGLLRLDPTLIDSPRMLYSFHYYDPMVVSHQGTTSSYQPSRAYLSGIAYPPSLQNANASLQTVQNAIYAAALTDTAKSALWTEAQGLLQAYFQTDQGIDTTRSDFARVTAWANTYRIPASRIILGEFGIMRPGPPYASAVKYIHDVRQAAEEAGFGWSYWNYSPVDDVSTQGFSLLRLQGSDPMALDSGIVQRGLGWTMP